MVTVRAVSTGKDRKQFVEFPLRLYKNNEYFVPCLYGDEMSLLKGKNSYGEVSETEFFLAERDGKVVGRIQAIIQHQYNELHNEKRARFTRFDAINDVEVSNALFAAAEKWAKDRGMDTICGPLGFSDLDREGLLIEGFDQTQTFEEQYNYDYYPALVEAYGFKKEVDWLEFRLFAPEKQDDMFSRLSKRVLEMHGLHLADTTISKKKYINKYKDGVFECIDRCYRHLYGTVPFTDEMKDEIIGQFLLLLSPENLLIICDKDEKVVSFALCFPAIGSALQKSGGRLTIPALLKLMKIVKKPKVLDLGLVGVLPEYQNAGLNAVYIDFMISTLVSGKFEYFETNLNLETNHQVMAQWKYLKAVNHKRRRAYIKSID